GGTVTAGTNNGQFGGVLMIAANSGTTGSYTISSFKSTPILNVAGNAYVGGNNNSPGGTGVFNIQAGNITIGGTLKIWNTTGSKVNLSGGELTINALDTSGNPSLFNWTGGTLNFSSAVTINSNFMFGSSITLNTGFGLGSNSILDNNGSVTLNGGTLLSNF